MSSIKVTSKNFWYKFQIDCSKCGKKSDVESLDVHNGLIICPNCEEPL